MVIASLFKPCLKSRCTKIMCSFFGAFGLSLRPGAQASGLSGGGEGSDVEAEGVAGVGATTGRAGTKVGGAGVKAGARGERREAFTTGRWVTEVGAAGGKAAAGGEKREAGGPRRVYLLYPLPLFLGVCGARGPAGAGQRPLSLPGSWGVVANREAPRVRLIGVARASRLGVARGRVLVQTTGIFEAWRWFCRWAGSKRLS